MNSSPKNVRFNELATVFLEERLSGKSTDSESDEGVDTSSVTEQEWSRAKDHGNSDDSTAHACDVDPDHVARATVQEENHGRFIE
jgi:hypothetical protein